MVQRHPARQNGFVHVRGAQQNNLRNVDVDIPRDSFVVFTGVSGSGKSSIAFGTIYAEAQRRYFESIAPYARRLIEQLPAPRVREVSGLPPAVALQQRRSEANARSTVGTLTTLSNLLRMLFSRAGTYPAELKERLDSDSFSPNTLIGACSKCHGMGLTHRVTEESLVPNPDLTIREGAIAAWPGAWQGKNYRDILSVLGYDVDRPWKELSKKDRQWILFTEEKPVVTVHAVREAHRIQRPYQGTYMSAAVYVLHTFGTTNSATLRKRVAKFMEMSPCTECNGKRLNKKALSVHFGGFDISELGQMAMSQLVDILTKAKYSTSSKTQSSSESSEVASLIVGDLLDRLQLLRALGLDYLSLDRQTPTLSAGELQRLRLATQLRSGLFGVVYVLDEPSAGLHPADTQSLLAMLKQLQEGGNSLFIVEHDMELVRQADWIVDMGPGAGDGGGELIYSGPVDGLASAKNSITRRYVFEEKCKQRNSRRKPAAWMKLKEIYRNNIEGIDVEFPLGVLTAVTGISGAGKSTLVSQVLSETVSEKLGVVSEPDEMADGTEILNVKEERKAVLDGAETIKRLVHVDQKPIGRTPRSNLATYTGLFDHIRQAYTATPEAKLRGYNAGRFSFNVTGGRCENCEGEGFVSVELLFLPSVYTPCTACHGTRYNAETLQIKYRGKNVAEILDMTVDAAHEFFADDLAPVARALKTLRDVGLGYLHLGQPATELSGGEAQRIKLATELQRVQKGNTLYLLDEPSTGLHPADVEKLMSQLHQLTDAGNTVVVVENDMDVVVAADWVIDLGPGAGNQGGQIIAAGTPEQVSKAKQSQTAAYLFEKLRRLG